MKLSRSIRAMTGRKVFLSLALMIAGVLAISTLSPVPHVDAKTKGVRMVPESFSDLAEVISPTVVNIRTVKTIKGGGRVFRHFFNNPGQDDRMRDFFDRFFGRDYQREFQQPSLGSGFIIDEEGYIVTNNHVVDNADKIKVILADEKEYDGEIVGRDANTDLALIRIKPDKKLPFAKLGDSDALRVGQWVVAIGSPFGLEYTVTAGIVSAKGRDIGPSPYDDFIQTDASINPGNSGGPLIDMNGEVVGINTAINPSGQGIGFAIPINIAREVVSQLKEKGEVTRGWLGVSIQDLDGEMAEYLGSDKGALVAEVFEGDPADRAGIEENDIILELNGKAIANIKELTMMIAGIPVGEEITVKVLRDRKTKILKAVVDRRQEAQVASLDSRREQVDDLGIQVASLTPDMAERYNLAETQGVVVTEVSRGSKGAEAGVLHGDIIKEINHRPVKTVSDYRQLTGDVGEEEPIRMYIRRGNRRFLVVKITK